MNSNFKILQPKETIINVKEEIDWVFIMRKDTDYISQNLIHNTEIDSRTLEAKIKECYEQFFTELTDLLAWSFQNKNNVEFHIYENQYIENLIADKIKGCGIINLDPVYTRESFRLSISRGYSFNGLNYIKQVNSPNTESIDNQIANLKKYFNQDLPICLVDDDIFSGGSIVSVIQLLSKNNIDIQRVIPGIQVGMPSSIQEAGINVDPAIQYLANDNLNILSKVNLCDPGDFLIGARGLVTMFSSDKFGRSPYLRPFVSVSRKIGFDKSLEEIFAQKLFDLNIKFYQTLSKALGEEILVKHLPLSFIQILSDLYNINTNDRFVEVLDYLKKNISTLWGKTNLLSHKIEKLDSSKDEKCIFIDINDTLIKDGASINQISDEHLLNFNEKIKTLNQLGYKVGLFSDSPRVGLEIANKKLGLTDNTYIAENGNLIVIDGEAVTFSPLPEIDLIKSKIIEIAKSLNIIQKPELLSVTFGGDPFNYDQNTWAFGKGRENSVSVFGSGDFLTLINSTISKEFENLGIDLYVKGNYLGIHPYKEISSGKVRIIKELASLGNDVFTIGNSQADLVDHAKVKSFLVANHNVKNLDIQKYTVVTNSYFDGVLEALDLIINKKI